MFQGASKRKIDSPRISLFIQVVKRFITAASGCFTSQKSIITEKRGNFNKKQNNWAELLPAGLNDPKQHKPWIIIVNNKEEGKNVKQNRGNLDLLMTLTHH